MNTNQPKVVKSDEITLKDLIFKVRNLIQYLLSKKKIIIVSSMICALLGLTIAMFDKPTYKAKLTFALEDDKGGGGGGLSSAMGLASTLGIDLGSGSGGIFASSNILELMKSRMLIEKKLPS